MNVLYFLYQFFSLVAYLTETHSDVDLLCVLGKKESTN